MDQAEKQKRLEALLSRARQVKMRLSSLVKPANTAEIEVDILAILGVILEELIYMREQLQHGGEPMANLDPKFSLDHGGDNVKDSM